MSDASSDSGRPPEETAGSGLEAREPLPPDGDDGAEDEVSAAAEREAQSTTVALDASVLQRFVAAVTGTSVLVTILAILSALAVGAVLIALSDEATRTALGYFTARPGDTFSAAWTAISRAYSALLRGSVGGVVPLSETLVAATPLILTGLAVAVPFRAGLFNIGGESQVIAGGIVAGFLGFSLTGLPTLVHLPLAVLGGMAAGAFAGWIPGVLKARTGAHEVITTIMLNNTFVLVNAWLLGTALFRQPDRTDPISQNVEASAVLPRLVPGMPNLRVHMGLVLALALAVVIFWLVERSTKGFELNAVGLNPHAATTAGMDVNRTVITAMTVGGAMAGVAGVATILGVQQRITSGFSAGLGFDGITVALLGRGKVGGTVAAGLLFGALKAGGRFMQAETQTSLDLVLVIQALIIVFIAAPGLVKALFRIKADDLATGQVAKGWGA